MIEQTWTRASLWNFNKEVFLAWKLPAFVGVFDIVVLRRKASNVFPPSRSVVWAWYDSIYQSLVMNGFEKECGRNVFERGFFAFRAAWAQIDSVLPEAATLDYDDLMMGNRDEVTAHLQAAGLSARVDVDVLARRIVDERKNEHKTWRLFD